VQHWEELVRRVTDRGRDDQGQNAVRLLAWPARKPNVPDLKMVAIAKIGVIPVAVAPSYRSMGEI